MAAPSEIFERINKNVAENPEKATSIDAMFQFDLSGDSGGVWTIDLRSGAEAPHVTEGGSDDSNVTISMTDDDFNGIFDGSVNPMQAFMMGKIKVSGDMGLAMKLQNILSLGAE